MKRRRRSHKRKSNPSRKRRHHRRAALAALFQPKRRRRHRRRRNPSLPIAAKNVGKTLGGVLLGGLAGAGVSLALDKINVGGPLVRELALVGSGIAAGALLGGFAPGLASPIGAGLAGVGVSRTINRVASGEPLFQTKAMLVAAPRPKALAARKKSIRGLGLGDGADMEGAYEQVGYVEGPDDDVGYVEGPDDDVGYVEGPDDDMGYVDDVGDSEMDGAYDSVGEVQ